MPLSKGGTEGGGGGRPCPSHHESSDVRREAVCLPLVVVQA